MSEQRRIAWPRCESVGCKHNGKRMGLLNKSFPPDYTLEERKFVDVMLMFRCSGCNTTKEFVRSSTQESRAL